MQRNIFNSNRLNLDENFINIWKSHVIELATSHTKLKFKINQLKEKKEISQCLQDNMNTGDQIAFSKHIMDKVKKYPPEIQLVCAKTFFEHDLAKLESKIQLIEQSPLFKTSIKDHLIDLHTKSLHLLESSVANHTTIKEAFLGKLDIHLDFFQTIYDNTSIATASSFIAKQRKDKMKKDKKQLHKIQQQVNNISTPPINTIKLEKKVVHLEKQLAKLRTSTKQDDKNRTRTSDKQKDQNKTGKKDQSKLKSKSKGKKGRPRRK
jgi:hypothetical protein